MPRVRALPLAAVVSLLLGAAGCGSSAAPEQSAQVPPAAASSAPAASADAGVTEGRLGDASSAAVGSGSESVSPGGEVDPSVALAPPSTSEGVGAIEACDGRDDLPTPSNTKANIAATLCLLNVERDAKGLPRLTENPKLAKAAQGYAASMVAKRFFGHVGPDGSTMVARVKKTGYLTGRWTIGENLAWGSGELATPRAIVNAWMNSDGHRRNILDSGFKHIGLALANGTPTTDGSAGATYVNEFGANGTAISLRSKRIKGR